MKLTKDQVSDAKKFMDLVNSKCKEGEPFRLLKEKDNEYSIVFLLPEFGIEIAITGSLKDKKE